MNIKIVVAAHKEYPMPQDSIYFPVHVGKEISSALLPYAGDNTGDNISNKNPYYCELTAMYWAWKNMQADYIGLAHYRRHFVLKKPFPFIRDKFSYVLNSTQVESILKSHPILLPKKRNYFIETNYSHFIHAHPPETISIAKEILKEQFPSYLPAFEQVMNATKAHRFNMFIMRQDIFQDYCHWLFSILFQLECRLDLTQEKYSRIFGYVSERLQDVYLEANQLSYAELPVLFMEKERWIKKIFSFLRRKFVS